MANQSGDVRAGGAYVEITGDDAALDKALNRAHDKVARFSEALNSIGNKLAIAGSAVTGALTAGAVLFGKQGAALMSMSARTGIAVEQLSELKYAAELAGMSLDDVGMFIRFMQRELTDAVDGTDSAVASFTALGLSVEDLKKLSPDEQFMAILKAIKQIPDPARRTAAAMRIFGRAGMWVLPLIDTIEDARLEAKEFGLTTTEEAARVGKEFNKVYTRLKIIVQEISAKLGAQIIPLLKEFAERATEIAVKVMKWVDENGELIRAAFKLAGAIVLIGTSFKLASLAVTTFMFIMSPTGVLLLIGIALLAIADAVGLIDIGFTQAANHIRIDGVRLSTYLAAIGMEFYKTWLYAVNEVAKAFTKMIWTGKTVWSYLKTGWNVLSSEIALAMVKAYEAVQKVWLDLKEGWLEFQFAMGLVGTQEYGELAFKQSREHEAARAEIADEIKLMTQTVTDGYHSMDAALESERAGLDAELRQRLDWLDAGYKREVERIDRMVATWMEEDIRSLEPKKPLRMEGMRATGALPGVEPTRMEEQKISRRFWWGKGSVAGTFYGAEGSRMSRGFSVEKQMLDEEKGIRKNTRDTADALEELIKKVQILAFE